MIVAGIADEHGFNGYTPAEPNDPNTQAGDLIHSGASLAALFPMEKLSCFVTIVGRTGILPFSVLSPLELDVRGFYESYDTNTVWCKLIEL